MINPTQNLNQARTQTIPSPPGLRPVVVWQVDNTGQAWVVED